MAEDNRTNVLDALEIVLEGIEAEIKSANRDGARIFETGDHQKVKDALERAEQIKSLREMINEIRDEWLTLFSELTDRERTNGDTNGSVGDRLPKGVRTPENLYYRPILESLKDLGGAAHKSEVLAHVQRRMKETLREVDFKPVHSSNEPRWRNTAAWARNTLVEKGLMRKDSRRGIWEISDSGMRFLQEGKNS